MTRSRSSKDQSFLSAASAYAERGWPVFPLVPREKRPFPNTEGLYDASTDRNKVLLWWQAVPDANVGLRTGVAFDVLDIDNLNDVSDLQALLGADYRHAGPVVRTGKGVHLYFQPMENARNRAGILGGKVDYRGTGGYVVAPPSIHPSGHRYEWDGNRDASLPLPVVPEVLRPRILGPNPATRTAVAVAAGGKAFGDTYLDGTPKARIIAERPDIFLVAQDMGLQVKKMGAYWVTLCIFHAERTPSMVLYEGQNKFHCYGCEAHGDSFDLQNRRDMTGRQAL